MESSELMVMRIKKLEAGFRDFVNERTREVMLLKIVEELVQINDYELPYRVPPLIEAARDILDK